jgi:hypothetical protein
MLRLLARVDKVRTRDTFVEGGMRRSRVYCYVTVKSPARSTFKMPKGLKGKKIRVSRTYLHPYRIEPGDLLVLDPGESQAAVREHVRLKPLRSERPAFGEKMVAKASSESDGLRNYVMENAFLRSVISPDYGARVSELHNLGTGHNELYGGGGYGAMGYVLLGGVEESLSRVGKPPDLWNALYRKIKSSDHDLAFEHNLEKKQGVKQVKSFLLLADAPLLCQLSTFEFRPKKPRKKGKTEKMELNYVPRIFFGIGGKTSYTNLFYVPTDEELVRMRYNIPPWEFRWGGGIWDWRKKWHAVRPGFVLLASEETGECMALFADPKQLSFAWLGYNLGTPQLHLSHLPRKLKAKEKITYGIGMSVGSAFDVTKRSLLMVSKGRELSEGIPFAILYRGMSRSSTLRASLSGSGSKRAVELPKVQMRGFGHVYFNSLLLDPEMDKVSVELAVGRDHLKAEVTG